MTEKLPRPNSVEKPESIVTSTPDQLTALYAGLDAAAQTAETWKAGLRAYEKSMKDGLGIDQARWDALDAAAPDSDYWKNGLNTIEASLVDTQTAFDEAITVPAAERQVSPEKESYFILSAWQTEKAAYRHKDGTGNQDTVLVDAFQKIYGVYDGAGGAGGNPAAASRAAADSIHASLSNITPRSTAEFLELLQQSHVQAERDVVTHGEYGTTVATTVKILEIEGITYAGIAHAGDTRLFLYDAENMITPLTPDQSDGNRLSNCLSSYNSAEHDQFSVRKLNKGERFMLCSDGITGDWEHQLLSDSEFQDAFRQQTPAQCAARFIDFSKKEDDKTIVVFDVDTLWPKN